MKLLAICLIPLISAEVLPIITFHGIGDACINPGMGSLAPAFGKAVGAPYTKCIEYGASFASWFTSLSSQVKKSCDIIKADPKLNGQRVSAVGLSQGNLVARGVIQTCDAVTIVNYVSIGGPQSGTETFPNCESGIICDTLNGAIRLGVYSSLAQSFVAPAEYFKAPMLYAQYLAHSAFLPDLNNEKDAKNAVYKQRFSALERLVLIKYLNDTVLEPVDTEWFQYYTPGSTTEILPLAETPLYKEDWIGLRTLDEAGKVSFVATEGNHLSHLSMTDPLVIDHILPALKSNTASSSNLRGPVESS